MTYTYFFHSPKTGLTKIGRTSNVGLRFQQLRRKYDHGLLAAKVLKGDKEWDFHQRYSKYRQKGEWFEIPFEVASVWLESPVDIDREFPIVRRKSSLISIDPKAHERLKRISKKTNWKIKEVATAMVSAGLDAYDAGTIVLAEASAQPKSITQDRSKK